MTTSNISAELEADAVGARDYVAHGSNILSRKEVEPADFGDPSSDGHDCEDDYDCEIVGERAARIPDGEYVAKFIGHDTARVFGSDKVFLRFKVVSGQYVGTGLFIAYRAQKLTTKPGPAGKFTLSQGSRLTKDLRRLIQGAQRRDRVSLRQLLGNLWRVTTRTVDHDHKKRAKPEALQYSVIDEILGAALGG